MLSQALQGAAKAGLYMPFDADDLIAPDGVANLRKQHPGGRFTGALITHGVILNASTWEIAPTRPKTLLDIGQKPFWKFCGSCAAFPFDVRDHGADIEMFWGLSEHEHRLYPHLAQLAGMELVAGAVPGVTYVIAHGDNFETRRGRGSFKQRFVHRYAVRPSEQSALWQRYGWDG